MKARSFVVPAAVRSTAFAAAAVVLAAPAARAQYANAGYPSSGGTAVYEWQGRVDKEIRLQLRDSRASVIRVGDRETVINSGHSLSTLPQRPGQLTVERLEGRGNVDVIQQPSSANGYTAVLRMVDGDAGAANYHLIAYWQPVGGYGGGNGGYGGYDGRGDRRDGRDDRRDARDDHRDGRDDRRDGGWNASGGYDRNGYDRDGYDRGGYDRSGYNRAGFDRNGFDRNGYDRNGRDRHGKQRPNDRGNNGRGHAYGHDKH